MAGGNRRRRVPQLAAAAGLSLLLGSNAGGSGPTQSADLLPVRRPSTIAPAGSTTTVPTPVDPAMLDPAVTQASIAATICIAGYTATVRPPTSLTGPLKVRQIASYDYADRNVADYEEDHVIALELGGAPAAPVNLFPEPRSSSGADDALENLLHARVCSRLLTLADAQAQILAAKVRHGYRPDLSGASQSTTTTAAPRPPG